MGIYELILVVIFTAISIWLYKGFVDASRLKAKYLLYAVRDKLVYLVAMEELSENDPIFQEYYKKVNNLLGLTPNVGLDDFLDAAFYFKKTGRDVQIKERAKLQLERLKSHSSMKSPAVQEVVSEFYKAVQFLLITHSSFTRVAYIVVFKFGLHGFVRYVPKKFSSALGAVEVIEEEVAREGLNKPNFC